MTNYQDTAAMLQSWFSPAFPVGGFNYSHGLETAIQTGLVTDQNSLFDWISGVLKNGSGRNDALFVKAAYRGEECNMFCLSLASSKERYMETLELGSAFTKTVNSSFGLALEENLANPVVVGLAAASIKLDLRLTIQSFLQSFASNLISVAVRHIPLGQTAGQSCLAKLLPIMKMLTDEIMASSLHDIGGSAVVSDLVSMRHEYDEMRIYRT